MSESKPVSPQSAESKTPAEQVTAAFRGVGGAMQGLGDVIRAHQAEGDRMRKELGRDLTIDEDRAALAAARRNVKAAETQSRTAQEPVGHTHRADQRDLTAVRRSLAEQTGGTEPRRMRNREGREFQTESVTTIPLAYDEGDRNMPDGSLRSDQEGLYLIEDTQGGQWQLYRADGFHTHGITAELAGDGSFGRKMDVSAEGDIRDAKFNSALDNAGWVLVNASPDLPPGTKTRAHLIGKITDPSHSIDVGKPFGLQADSAAKVEGITLAHVDRYK